MTQPFPGSAHAEPGEYRGIGGGLALIADLLLQSVGSIRRVTAMHHLFWMSLGLVFAVAAMAVFRGAVKRNEPASRAPTKTSKRIARGESGRLGGP